MEIRNESGDRDNFTIIPNFVFRLGMTPYTVALYGYIKQAAGETGRCYKSTATISKELGMSAGTVSVSKQELEKNRLIRIDEVRRPQGGKPYHSIAILDVWQRNSEFINTHRKECSQGEQANSGSEIATSPSEIINIPLNKNPESTSASKNDAPPTPESPQSKAQREKYAQAISEFTAREEHKADPKREEREYKKEVAPIISKILGREGYTITEDKVAAQRMFNLNIPLEFVRDKEADYRNGVGEDFSNPDATAFWVANRYEKDFALSRIEGNTHGQIARTYDDYIEKRTAELRGFGFTDAEIAKDLRTQGLAPRAEDAPKPSTQAMLVRAPTPP